MKGCSEFGETQRKVKKGLDGRSRESKGYERFSVKQGKESARDSCEWKNIVQWINVHTRSWGCRLTLTSIQCKGGGHC